MGIEVDFIGISKLRLNHEKGTNHSKHIATDFTLMLSPNLDEEMYLDEEDIVTKEGSRMLTLALVHGLIGNIHLAHKKGWKNDVVHLKEIIDELSKGFATVATVSIGEL